MRTLKCILSLLAGALTVAAGVLYDNGPGTGQAGAWGMYYPVADSFTLAAPSNVTGANLYVWVTPGDSFTTLDWSILSSPIGGTTFASGSAAVSTSYGSTIGATFDLDLSTFSIPEVALDAGTYWLMIQNAEATNGDSVYWDVNDGPSQVWDFAEGGYISPSSCTNEFPLGTGNTCSDGFEILGDAAPEPATLAPLGCGLLLLCALRRHKVA